jgi:hypothetical protein
VVIAAVGAPAREIKMGVAFWVKRFLLVLAVAFVVLVGAELVKGHPQAAALQFAAGWSFATSTIFTLASYLRYRRNPACWLPGDREA